MGRFRAPAQDRSITSPRLELSEPVTVRNCPPCPTDPPFCSRAALLCTGGPPQAGHPGELWDHEVTSMAQRIHLASVTLHRSLGGDRPPVPVGGCSFLRAGQEGREAPPNNLVAPLSCSCTSGVPAPAPQFPWLAGVDLSFCPSLFAGVLRAVWRGAKCADPPSPVVVDVGPGHPRSDTGRGPWVHCPAQDAPAQAGQGCPCSAGTATVGLGTDQESRKSPEPRGCPHSPEDVPTACNVYCEHGKCATDRKSVV